MIDTAPFGRTGHDSSRIIFGNISATPPPYPYVLHALLR